MNNDYLDKEQGTRYKAQGTGYKAQDSRTTNYRFQPPRHYKSEI